MKFASKSLIVGFIIAAYCSGANAGIVIGGTRIIFEGNKKEATISVSNPDEIPYLVQSWIEPAAGSQEAAPFIVTPPLFRLNKGQQNMLRVVRKGNLPEDKESLYWMDVKGIPSAVRHENTLQIAVKSRFKLIYRPAALKDSSAEEQAEKLVWQKSGNQVRITNPTPYVINFNQIVVDGKALEDVTYVAPASSAVFKLPESVSGGAVTYKLINDYGGVGETHKAKI